MVRLTLQMFQHRRQKKNYTMIFYFFFMVLSSFILIIKKIISIIPQTYRRFSTASGKNLIPLKEETV